MHCNLCANKNKIFVPFLLSIMLIMSVFCLAGCDKDEEFDETEIIIRKNGTITENIVESFDKDYYNLDELKTEFTNEIAEYNESIGSEEITLEKLEQEGGNVYATLDFTGPSDYENFIKEDMFVGSIGDAYDHGYTMDVSLKGVESGDIINKVAIMGKADSTIIILSEPVKVTTFKEIAYVSANVDVLGSNKARILSESGGLAYIVLK